MTYLVMECHPAYAVVLDQAGRVIKVANMGYEVGQKVDHVIEQQHRPALLPMRVVSMVAAACLCLAGLGGGGYGACFLPYGTVHLTINPDVRMYVSYMDRVVGLEGLNEDGDRLIDQVPYKGKHAEEITGLLVERAVDMGYLADGGTVMVKADGGSARWKQKRESDIGNWLKRQFDGRMEVEIKVGDDAGDRKDTDVNNRTPGQEVPVGQPAARPAASHRPSVPARPAAAPAVPKDAEGAEKSPGGGTTGDRDNGDDEDDDRDDRGKDDGGRDDGDEEDDGRDDEDEEDGGRDDEDEEDGGRDDGDEEDRGRDEEDEENRGWDDGDEEDGGRDDGDKEDRGRNDRDEEDDDHEEEDEEDGGRDGRDEEDDRD